MQTFIQAVAQMSVHALRSIFSRTAVPIVPARTGMIHVGPTVVSVVKQFLPPSRRVKRIAPQVWNNANKTKSHP